MMKSAENFLAGMFGLDWYVISLDSVPLLRVQGGF